MAVIPSAREFDYSAYLGTTWQEANSARSARETMWTKAWDVYHGRWDFSKKAGYQTKLNLPRFPQTVETAAAVLKRALVEARTWYVVEGLTDPDKQIAPLIKRLCDLWLRVCNFVVTFTDSIKLGGIVDFIPMRVTWPTWDEQEVGLLEPSPAAMVSPFGPPEPTIGIHTVRRSGLRIDLLDPFKVWIDPTGRNRYVIEESTTDLDELQRMAEVSPESWDKEQIDLLQTARSKAQEDYLQRLRQGLSAGDTPPWRKPIILRTFWGDVIDPFSGKVSTDVTFTMADETYLVGKPREIPYWHRLMDRQHHNKRGPIIWGSLFRIPLSAYGKGFAYDNLGLAQLLTWIACAIGDELQFASINAFEMDTDLLENPEQLKDGVYPGKTFLKRGSNAAPGRRLIEPITLGQVNPQSLAVWAAYDQQYQNSTGVTNYVDSGQAPQRKDQTLGEYQGRQTQALGLLDMVARNLEDQLLEPLLEMVYWTILQYMDDFDAPQVAEALGEDAMQLAAMSDVERFQYLKRGVRFQARGMSVVLSKSEELGKIAAFMQAVPQLAAVIPNLPQLINGMGLLRKVIESLNWDPDEVLNKPQEIGPEMEAMLGGTAPPGGVPNGLPPEMQAYLNLTPGGTNATPRRGPQVPAGVAG